MYKLVRGGENLNSNNEILQKKKKKERNLTHVYVFVFSMVIYVWSE